MAVLVIDKIQIKNNPTRPVVDAALVEVDATGFIGNLSITDIDVQTALETLDAMTAGSGDSFKTINTPSGTSPVADSATDILTLTSTGGTIGIAGDSATDTINLDVVAVPAGSVSGFDEAAQDAVGTILVDSSSIDFTYTDGTPEITAVVLPAGVDHNSLANLTSGDPHTQYVLDAGTVIDKNFASFSGTGGRTIQDSGVNKNFIIAMAVSL